ncbi:Hypothetical predicted protein, partial [Paramuricea clavata]
MQGENAQRHTTDASRRKKKDYFLHSCQSKKLSCSGSSASLISLRPPLFTCLDHGRFVMLLIVR